MNMAMAFLGTTLKQPNNSPKDVSYKLERLVEAWESDISTAMEFLKTMLELLNTTPKAVSYKTPKLVTNWELSINLAY